MKKKYDLAWLDNVITVELNPESEDLKSVTPELAKTIMARIGQEEVELMLRLKKRVFSINDAQQAKNLVKKYHDALLLLMSRNYDYLHFPTPYESTVKLLHEFIGTRLQKMLSIFEIEFHAFMDDGNHVPITRLIAQREEMYKREMEMKEKLSVGKMGTGPVHVVMEVFLQFSEKIDARIPITVHEAGYIKGLFENIIDLDDQYTSITGCPALNELLIVWNVNNKTCIQYFTQGTEFLMNEYKSPQEKLDFLKFELKKVQIIPEKQDFVLDPDFPSVKTYCAKWLQNEIAYRENRMEGFVPLEKEIKAKEKKQEAFKVLCSLSIDQFALIMRGADEKRILISPSLSAVYEAVTPFMSTKKKEDISPKSARNKAYNAEMSDKEKAKWALKEISDAIDGY